MNCTINWMPESGMAFSAETGSGHHHPHVTSSSRAAASNRPAATGERAAISIIGLIPSDGTPNRRRAHA